MRRRHFLGALGGAGLAAAGSGLATSGAGATGLFEAERRVPLLIGGSSTMLQMTEALVAAFLRENRLIDPVVAGGGSLAGLLALKRGAIDMAAMSTDLTVEQDELFVRNYLVAKDCLGLVVHPSNPLSNLTIAQARAIFTGAIDDWGDVGGPDGRIVKYARPQRTTTQVAANTLIMDGNEMDADAAVLEEAADTIAAVAAEPRAIGYVAMQYFSPKVKVLAVNSIPIHRETILSGRYPFTRSFYYVLRGDSPEAARDFLLFAVGPKGQAVLGAMDVVPAT